MNEEKMHALLSASKAHRWLTCTPSARAEQAEGVEECSVYAEEGTAAHAYAEILLSYRYGKIGPIEYSERMAEWHTNPSYEKYYNEEFKEYVEIYCNFVDEHVNAYKKNNIDYSIYFEISVNFSNIVPQGFGTSDTLIVTEDTIEVIDLKFGIGVPVSAMNNPQLRLYGMGALNLFPNSKTIKMSICQPRLANTDTEVLTKKELLEWAFYEVKPKADMAIEGKGDFVASDACRFCTLRGKCKARADAQMRTAISEFSDNMSEVDGYVTIAPRSAMIETLSPEQLSQALDFAEKFESWCKDVRAYALGQLMQGRDIPGYKLVEGRANRIITDEEKVKQILLNVGFLESEIMKPAELLSISKLETLTGKKLFNELCKDYIVKPQGKMTLARETDRRPALNTLSLAKQDFSTPIE